MVRTDGVNFVTARSNANKVKNALVGYTSSKDVKTVNSVLSSLKVKSPKQTQAFLRCYYGPNSSESFDDMAKPATTVGALAGLGISLAGTGATYGSCAGPVGIVVGTTAGAIAGLGFSAYAYTHQQDGEHHYTEGFFEQLKKEWNFPNKDEVIKDVAKKFYQYEVDRTQCDTVHPELKKIIDKDSISIDDAKKLDEISRKSIFYFYR